MSLHSIIPDINTSKFQVTADASGWVAADTVGYKKNLPHRNVEPTHGFSNMSISQVTPIAVTLAMGIMTAIMALMYERRLKCRRREVATMDQQYSDGH
jgi:hypothetical protein